MAKCEKCEHEVYGKGTLCRFHRAEQQANRAAKVKGFFGAVRKTGPYLLILLTFVRGKFMPK